MPDRIFGGFACPKCGGDTRCVDSRRTVNGMVRRRKHCVVCRHRITTYEMETATFRGMIGNLKDLMKQANAVVRGVGGSKDHDS